MSEKDREMSDVGNISEKVFSRLGFEKCTFKYGAYGKYNCYRGPEGSFYMVEAVPGLGAYVIESAENEYEASHGMFEDSDLFDIHMAEDELEKALYSWIVRYALPNV